MGQCGLKPKLAGIGSSRSRCATQLLARAEARRLRELGELREARRERVALAHRRGELRRARALLEQLARAPRRDRRRSPPRAARGRAGRSACARARAATCARPSRRPRAGCRGRARPCSTSSPPARRSPSHSSQASAKRASACASSAIRKPGRTPHSSGRSWRQLGAERVDGRDARALQHVERAADAGALLRRRARRVARARSSRSRSRSFIVVAAFSVKVTAAISSSRAVPERTIASMRSTSSVVLPVPAPASSTRLVAWSRRARSRASSSAGRKALTRCPAAAGTPAAPRRAACRAWRRCSRPFGPHTTVKSQKSQARRLLHEDAAARRGRRGRAAAP